MDRAGQANQGHELDTKPLYNIKAATEATGLPATTLRAWERRYGALSPGRTSSGYRLYSEHDIAILRWLKARVDAGMSISRAIELLSRERERSRPQAIWWAEEHIDSLPASRQALLVSLLRFDEARSDEILEQAFAAYGLEGASERIIAPAAVQIGEGWHKGQVSTAAEHFASSYLRRKLESVINAVPRREEGSLIVLGCAPNDWHELGLLLIYLFLLRRGYRVLYLGQNVPLTQFIEEMKRLRPALVMISASTEESVAGLIQIGQAVESMDPPRPLFGFGGASFNRQPELRERVPGFFLGENARQATDNLARLLQTERRETMTLQPLRGSVRKMGGGLH
jgi:MerR family transcriptional regulator, light-induced transcriptional regulator